MVTEIISSWITSMDNTTPEQLQLVALEGHVSLKVDTVLGCVTRVCILGSAHLYGSYVITLHKRLSQFTGSQRTLQMQTSNAHYFWPSCHYPRTELLRPPPASSEIFKNDFNILFKISVCTCVYRNMTGRWPSSASTRKTWPSRRHCSGKRSKY